MKVVIDDEDERVTMIDDLNLQTQNKQKKDVHNDQCTSSNSEQGDRSPRGAYN